MIRLRARVRVFTLAILLSAPAGAEEPESDPRAVALARSALEAMGGADAWSAAHYLHWNFRGRRVHDWDRTTGNVRIEAGNRLVLMNVRDGTGSAWEDGQEITDEAALGEALEQGHAWWVNDAYWLIMPYKMLDPGVVLRYAGPGELPDGRAAEIVTLTFDDDVGLTPRNRYEVWIAADTGLVEQWAYYRDRDDPEPRLTSPWSGWQRFGGILLSTDRGDDHDWEIAVADSVPAALFEQP